MGAIKTILVNRSSSRLFLFHECDRWLTNIYANLISYGSTEQKRKAVTIPAFIRNLKLAELIKLFRKNSEETDADISICAFKENQKLFLYFEDMENALKLKSPELAYLFINNRDSCLTLAEKNLLEDVIRLLRPY